MVDYPNENESTHEEVLEEAVVENLAEATSCISLVHQNVCVEALVTVKPRVAIGPGIKVHCGKTHISKAHNDTPNHGHKTMRKASPYVEDFDSCRPHGGECSFRVNQDFCITIPLVFSAEAMVKPDKVSCERPGEGPCRTYGEEDIINYYVEDDEDY